MLRIVLALALAAVCFADAGGAPVEDVDEKDVVVLTPDNFDDVIQRNDHVLVEFYAPWCGHCKRLVPEYAAAATKLKEAGLPAVLAKVDADEHKELGSRYGVQGFPTLKWFVRGTPTEYKGGRTAPDIVAWITKRVSDPVTILANGEDFDKFVKSNEFAIVGFFNADSEELATFKKVAAADDEMPYAAVTDASLAATHSATIPSVVAYRPEILPHQSRTVKHDGELNEADIAKFVAAHSLGLVTEFTQEAAPKIFGHPIKNQVLLFTDKADASTASTKDGFVAAAAGGLGKAIFVSVDVSSTNVLDYFGVKKDDLPCVYIVRSTANGLAKYQMKETPTTETVSAFLAEFLAGNVKPHRKSEQPPMDNHRPLKVVVGHTFDEIVLNTEKDVLIEFYAPWCGHCKTLEPIYEKVAADLAPVQSITIAKMDATANDAPENADVRGFPTLLLYKANDKEHPVTFNGDRTAKGIKAFLSKEASIPFEMPKKKKKGTQ